MKRKNGSSYKISIGVRDVRDDEKVNISLESSHMEGFLIIDNDKIINCNTRFQEILGETSEKGIVGHKFYELSLDSQPNGKKTFDLYKEMIDEAQLNGKSRFEFQFQSAMGGYIWAEVVFISRHFEDKEVIHAIVKDLYSDINNRNNLDTDELYSSIFNNTHTPMLVIDSESGEIRDGNVAACNYYGYTAAEIIQLNINEINTLNNEELLKQMEKARLEDKKYFEFKHRLSSGEIREVEVYSGPIIVKGEHLLLSIIHDVQYKKDIEEKIKIQESYFQSLYENSPEAIAILDNEFRIININGSFERIFQYSIDEIKNQNITKILCEEKLYDESSYFKDSIKRGEFVREETRRKRKDGKLVEVSFLGYPILSNGEQIGVYSFYSDLSNVKETESKKRLFAEIFQNNTIGVVVTNVEGNIQWINDMFTEITGYVKEEVVGRKPSILKSGEHETDYYCNMWNAILSAGKWQGEIFNRRKSGELYQEWLSIIAIKDDRGNIEHFVGMLSDITDVKQRENRIEILTNRDNLTDLYNRDYFVNKLNYEVLKRNKEQEQKDKRELAIIFLDIDDFKEINDTLGHLIGDNVLKEFAFRLKGSLREQDIAARFGGDEFIILLLSIKEDYEILSIANRILEDIKRPFLIENIELHITASLGISRYPKDGIDSTTLIRNADIAMYRSKEVKSKKITVFEPSLDEKVKEYFKIKNNLRNAITNQEFFVEYQPIIDINNRNLVGVEALLRWRLKAGEIISPVKFIPVAEKNGFMQSIGEWVLRAACEQNRAWQDKGHVPIYVSVNVSIMQLEQSNFCDILRKVLKESNLNPKYLQLEITETIFTKNYDDIVQTIKRINALGVAVAIDDFGTGYSSLGQLSRLEITKLKIDRSFISEINDNENKNKIVKAIISLAESLNFELVAEGVETKEQLDFLKKNDCSIVQGFLFSRPLAADEVERQFQKEFDS
ncbi:MAG: domain S-box/diguanylate cyclase protein [Clostridia bacterium]|nr:domain S-box/diguanylate cyclase protein [Clostridia bacterium]